MCCKIDSSVVVFEEGEEEKVFYKVVTASRESPYYPMTTYHTGSLVRSSRSLIELDSFELQREEITWGIHVLLTQEQAADFKDLLVRCHCRHPDDYRIISVRAEKKDLVGAGNWFIEDCFPTAVFMKVTVLD